MEIPKLKYSEVVSLAKELISLRFRKIGLGIGPDGYDDDSNHIWVDPCFRKRGHGIQQHIADKYMGGVQEIFPNCVVTNHYLPSHLCGMYTKNTILDALLEKERNNISEIIVPDGYVAASLDKLWMPYVSLHRS